MQRHWLTLGLGLALAFPTRALAQVPSAQAQIAGATSAAPETMRAGAAVLGYTSDRKLELLRPGTNDLICLADDPTDTRWQVSCYHKDLEPFMKRGRELKAAGVARGAEDSVRLAEIQAGKLKMPDGPRALFNLYAPMDSVDAATGLARHPTSMQVVYMPYATPESTGLPAAPGAGLPWLMYPGKPWAHVMIMH
ncbi:MAG TPA: hypothetical protein VG692_02935 [Gemmatimonadales bacterium]|nr:hypothetical protein [Gemmatimonadales bacterium]